MNVAGSSGIADTGWGGEFLCWMQYRLSGGQRSEDTQVRLRQIVLQVT
jgi:hypothetical protein